MSNDLKYKLFDSTDCISEQAMFDYIDNKLLPREQHLVEKHLIDCELCSDALEGLKLLKTRSKINVLRENISSKVKPSTHKVVQFNYRIAVSVAAGLLLLLGSVFFFNQFVSKEAQKEDMAELKTAPEKVTVTLDEQPRMDSMSAATGSSSLSGGANVDEQNSNSEVEVNNQIKTLDSEDALAETQQQSNGLKNEAAEGDVVLTDANTVSMNKVSKNAEQESKPRTPDEASKTTVGFSAPAASTYTWTSTTDKDLTKEEEKTIAPTTTLEKEQVATKNSKDKGKEKKESDKKSNRTEKADEANTVGNVAYAPVDIAQKADDHTAVADSLFAGLASVRSAAATEPVEELPQFPGGESMLYKFIANNAKWPALANGETILSSKIIIQFTVDKTGVIKNPRILKGINTAIDNEALRVVKLMPNWKPAQNKGVAVDCIFNLPIQLEFK